MHVKHIATEQKSTEELKITTKTYPPNNVSMQTGKVRVIDIATIW